ncbi:MAG: regulatory protein RecX [Alistipes sp.]
MVPKIKRDKTPEQALAALMRLCAKAERSSGDALRLMHRWGLSDADSRKVLERLVKDGFVDDCRYAEAFVRDKINLSGWGVYKIAAALRAKGIAQPIIGQATEQLATADMPERLQTLIARRLRTLKAKSPFDARAKLLRYAISQGYDYETARECVEAAVADKGDDIEF